MEQEDKIKCFQIGNSSTIKDFFNNSTSAKNAPVRMVTANEAAI